MMKRKSVILIFLFTSLFTMMVTSCHTSKPTSNAPASATPDEPSIVTASPPSATIPMAGAIVELVPQETDIHPDQTIHVNVTIKHVENLYGIELHVVFDPTMLAIVDGDSTKDGIQIQPGTFLKPDFVVRNQADDTKGIVDYVVTQVMPTEPASGQGTLATMEFRVLKAGQATLTPTILLAAPDGQAIIVTTQPIQITVTE